VKVAGGEELQLCLLHLLLNKRAPIAIKPVDSWRGGAVALLLILV